MVKRFGSSMFKDGRREIHVNYRCLSRCHYHGLSDFPKKETSALKVVKFLATMHILEGHFEVPSKSKHIPFTSMQLSKFIILTFI